MKQLLLAAALLSLAPSCVIAPERSRARDFPGFLVVDWSIEGLQDPFLCDDWGVSDISIVVSTQFSGFVGEFQQACPAFATSIRLNPGTYVADAVLLDFSGFERTTAVQIDPFRIFGDDELVVPIDFPAASFY